MSLTVTLQGTSSVLKACFQPPLEADPLNYVIGLIDFHTYNSIPNIDNTNNIVQIGSEIIEIPEGTYEIPDICEYLNEEIKKRLEETEEIISLRINKNTLRSEIECSREVDFTSPRTLAPSLGFFKGQILQPGQKHISPNPIDNLRVNDVRIECNIAKGSFVNGRPSRIIYGFFPDVEVGFNLVARPAHVIYYPIAVDRIDEIVVRIVDQKGRLVNFRGEHITVRLHLQDVRL